MLRGYATVCRLSVTFRYPDRWYTSKIILLLISLRFMLGWPPKWAIWSKGNIPKIRVEQDHRSGVMSNKTCNISETLQDRTKVTMTD